MGHLEGSCTPGLHLPSKEASGLQDHPHKATEFMAPLQQDKIPDDPREQHTELQLENKCSMDVLWGCCAQGVQSLEVFKSRSDEWLLQTVYYSSSHFSTRK